MKKCIFIAAMALTLVSCDQVDKLRHFLNKDKEELELTRTELISTLATQDSLLALINDISGDMMQIKEMEQIVSTPGMVGETPSSKQQLANDMEAIKQALKERRERLNTLEKKLKELSGNNATLVKTIETLKAQIAQQEQDIKSLNEQLNAAHVQIAQLNSTVDSLNVSVVTEREGRQQAQQEAQQLDTQVNTVYYALGSKKELTQNNIIKGGFLRKTKIMQGDYDISYFTKADKRSLVQIPLHSKSGKVLTNQPADSYTITDGDGGKVLTITNPTRFWNASNFLVVQVD